MWMNSFDIQIAAQDCEDHPVLGPATRFLQALMEHTNENSDGWHSWPAPAKAAEPLMKLIQDNMGYRQPRSFVTITLADVEKTLKPIKRMSAFEGKRQFEKYGNRYNLDVDAMWKEACNEK